MSEAYAIQWPIVTLDFEASSLGGDSYPIEVGIARWEGPGHRASSWSRLIRPTAKWEARSSWNPASQAIHRIDRSRLADGLDPKETMELLNERCPIGTLAFCDGGRYDAHWLSELSEAAGIEPLLHLGSWHRLGRSLGEEAGTRLTTHRAPHEIVHRAGPDAMDHIRALAWAIGEDEPQFDVVDS